MPVIRGSMNATVRIVLYLLLVSLLWATPVLLLAEHVRLIIVANSCIFTLACRLLNIRSKAAVVVPVAFLSVIFPLIILAVTESLFADIGVVPCGNMFSSISTSDLVYMTTPVALSLAIHLPLRPG
ncbi:hypothetical protein M1B72_11065 [Geomonas paludis]|uniref:Uncharacterized protein n=1 Tax=Geomonas paludis TaxID=2740185 RepID=A0ABY4LJR5_9BACT|nr:hypothetical protein [Geomonas paludis]UPU38223.1 hypothetical protein M1B72_11065 [Geomonas paludis]